MSRRKRWVEKQKTLGLCTRCTKPARLRKDGKPSVFCIDHYDVHQSRSKKTQKARSERYQQNKKARDAALEELQARLLAPGKGS